MAGDNFESNQEFEGNLKPSSLEQAIFEKELWASRITEIPSNMQMRIAYDADGNVEYVGYAPRGLSTGHLDSLGNAAGWLLQKFTNYEYATGKFRVTARQIAYGNWDNYSGATYG